MSATVEQRELNWILENHDIRVTIDLSLMTAEVLEKISGEVWSMKTDGYRDIVVQIGDRMRGGGGVSLAEALEKKGKKIKEDGLHGLELKLSNFPPISVGGDNASVTVKYMIPNEGADLVVEVSAPGESFETFMLRECHYPRHFILGKGLEAYTVLPQKQGCIIPTGWPQEIHQRFQYTVRLYMPWFGAVRERSGYVAIVETPYDLGLWMDHSPEQETSVTIHWLPSMGLLRYPRRVRYYFRPSVSYVDLAKIYREDAMKIGRFRSLDDKVKENPNVGGLMGTIIAPVSICRHDARTKPPLHVVTSFEKRMHQVEKLKDLGVEKAVVHVDGWGVRGYDNLHPDYLPPCPDAGGWEGLIGFSKRTKELGYLFCLHDQYRDFYMDAPSFSEDLCIKDETGRYPHLTAWAGGAHSVLCATKALDFVKRNFSSLLDKGVDLTASYLDVFSVVHADECFDPKHPMTRSDCVDHRANVFKHVRSLGIVLSSEDASDWTIPYLDFVYFADIPYNRVTSGRGRAEKLGVPVPLFSLVYHDALVVPWILSTGEGYLRCLLHGGVPYLHIEREGYEPVKRLLFLAKIHEHIGKDEMTDHRFLSDDYSVEETSFSSGPRVRVDYKKKEYTVRGIPGIAEERGRITF